MSVSRREARRAAVFVLYQWDVTGAPLASLYEGEVDPWSSAIAEGVVERQEDLDRRIDELSAGWPAERLGAVERSVLRVALFELERGEEPAPVVVDEAVTLAKRYASDEAGKLVNGILGRELKERVPQP